MEGLLQPRARGATRGSLPLMSAQTRPTPCRGLRTPRNATIQRLTDECSVRCFVFARQSCPGPRNSSLKRTAIKSTTPGAGVPASGVAGPSGARQCVSSPRRHIGSKPLKSASLRVHGAGPARGSVPAAALPTSEREYGVLDTAQYPMFVQFFRQASAYIEGHRGRTFVLAIPPEASKGLE